MSIIKMKKITADCPNVIEKIKDIQGVYIQKGVDNTVFFEEKIQDSLIKMLNDQNCKYKIEEINENDSPKVILNNSWFFKPFCSILTDKALPIYGDLDPTAFYTICFCILFGVMFGDIGQGLILILLGIIWRRKNNYAIFIRVGMFSVLFGWLYGSLFGNEEIIGEWMRDHNLDYWRFGLLERNNTEILLLVVAGIGISMIVASIIINIIDKIRHKQIKEIYCRNNCLPALLFYLMMLLLASLALGRAKGKLLLIIAVAMMLISSALLFKEGKWKYLASSVIKYFSAIMAFLQVGCFALAHAFLMYIVYYVASLVPQIALLIIVVGNAIVMAIETTEVWHQCIHLILSTLHSFIVDEANS